MLRIVESLSKFQKKIKRYITCFTHGEYCMQLICSVYSRPELIDARVRKDPEEMSRSKREKDFSKVQRALFWFSEPAFVMGLYQLIQFGKSFEIDILLVLMVENSKRCLAIAFY